MIDNVGGFLQVDRDTRRLLRVLLGKVRAPGRDFEPGRRSAAPSKSEPAAKSILDLPDSGYLDFCCVQ
jgi:hypothetical protein